MDSASPTTTATSTNRGGRPKDWTDNRSRRLVRLYVYTDLKLEQILKLLEDSTWKPGRDAANKVKNGLLGNDARWMRPKNDEDVVKRFTSLRHSRLRSQSSASKTSRPADEQADAYDAYAAPYHGAARLDGDTLNQPYQRLPENVNDAGFIQPKLEPLDKETSPDLSFIPYHINEEANVPRRFVPSFLSRHADSRQGTGMTDCTDVSVTSTLRERLSSLKLEPKRAKIVLNVLKRYTIPKNVGSRGATPLSRDLSPTSPSIVGQTPFVKLDAAVITDPHDASYAVPGDFLKPKLFDRLEQCATAHSESHKKGTCWCRIAEEMSPLPSTLWPPSSVFSTQDPMRADAFGNTIFHYYAAVGHPQLSMLNLVQWGVNQLGGHVGHTNTAGQTLLHVLNPSWFDEGSRLGELLTILKNGGCDILATDVYGRNVFHIFHSIKKGETRIPIQSLDWKLVNRRDAFGLKPMVRPNRSPAEHDINQLGQRVESTYLDSEGHSPPRLEIPSDLSEGACIGPHTELLKVINTAMNVDQPEPLFEDSQGRNALHCLAEVTLDWKYTEGASRKERKRKHSEASAEQDAPTDQSTPRLNYLDGLLLAHVDANHYDLTGHTPLMMFVMKSRDDSRADKFETISAIRKLAAAGAKIEARNRVGETALHIAARMGKTNALKQLLELKANPNVRNIHGDGILDVIDNIYVHTEKDGAFNARLEACRVILTGELHATAVDDPTVLHEWGRSYP
ncbi:hypothetical protein F4778DRAFT_257720 [Xylariomycetidae sp. FL2044]|nr:hypothetical protein F4778DRAFT_257720 [Xylariomycetidae sp. FL2044]